MDGNRPFLPSDVAQTDPLALFFRSRAALAIAHLRGGNVTVDAVASQLWGSTAAPAVIRALANPISTDSAGAALGAVAQQPFLRILRSRSAAAQLFDAADRLDLTGVSRISLPMAPVLPPPAFVSEGAPLPAVRGTIGGAELGPARKLGFIVGLTGELSEATGQAAETIIRLAMTEAAALALDSAVFSAVAASEEHPGGLLAGVVPIAPAAGGGLGAMTADLKALVSAIADAGGGANIWLFAHPAQAVALKLLASGAFDLPVIPTVGLAEGTVVAAEAGAVASGFTPLPEIEVGREATIVWQDADPPPVSTPGAPNAIAAPVRSGFQEDTLSLRCIQRGAWAVRASGVVQVVEGVTW
ncbi:hypothetical protein [Phenylobacterium sp.]|jgi:hypothetical protein|uniref:hypothetical protein n=1 Tax=Phenylobacterium sp. TaxID=1871053 RepID=UPI003782FF64